MSLRIRIERTEAAANPSVGRRRGWTLAAATVAAGVLVTGVSYAYWSATATGSVQASARSANVLDVAIVTPVNDLYPGRAAEDVVVKLTNTNPYTVKVTALTTLGLTSLDPTNCPLVDTTVTPNVQNVKLDTSILGSVGGPGGYQITPNVTMLAGASANITLPGLIQMTINAPNGCQGKIFQINMTFTGTQV